jgi:hypothetical protein
VASKAAADARNIEEFPFEPDGLRGD